MIKSELTNGTKIFVIKTEHYVSLGVFVRALGNEYYTQISEEIEKIIHDTEHNPIKGYWDSDGFEEKIDELLNSDQYLKKLSKKSAEEILRNNLRMYGREGSIDGTDFEASYERGYVINKCYDMVREWIIKKFPHLKPTE